MLHVLEHFGFHENTTGTLNIRYQWDDHCCIVIHGWQEGTKSILMWLIHVTRFIKKNCQPVQNPLTLYCLHACPPPILYPPMHALPYSIPPHAWPPPYSILPHAWPPPILSHPMHDLPLFYPTSCMPSPYSVPLHACPPPILSQPMHTLPYSIPTHAYHPPILSQPMHTLSLFSSSSHMPPQYSILFYSILFQPMHALLTRHLHLEGMFLLWHLHIPLLNVLTLSISSSSFTLLGNLEHHFVTFVTSECLLFSFTWTHHLYYILVPLLNYICITYLPLTLFTIIHLWISHIHLHSYIYTTTNFIHI